MKSSASLAVRRLEAENLVEFQGHGLGNLVKLKATVEWMDLEGGEGLEPSEVPRYLKL